MTDWFREAFRRDYLRVYPHRDDAQGREQVAAWLGRLPGLEAERPVLDLACGAGRHLRALGAAGVKAVGCDLSIDLLEEAAGRGSPPVVAADMRRVPFRDGVFAAVTSFFSSFGYFPTEDDDAAVLVEVARVLAPGGGFLLDLMDPDTVRAGLVPRSERTVDGVRIEETRSLADGGGRVEKHVVFTEGDRRREWTESVRLWDPEAVAARAAAVGLRAEGCFGDHGPGAWKAGGTPRCVMVFTRTPS